jgi:hypothetical protein
MDWNDLGKFVGPILIKNAPTIGGLLGGLIPIPGGSIIGEQAGALLAQALGVSNDPTSVANAIQNDPNAAAKITAAETEAAARWPALAEIARAQFESNSKQAETINATMQAELAKGQPWWAWRNLYGYSVALEATATSWVILYAIVIEPKLFVNVSNSLSFFLSWYGMRFGLLGYIHNQATQEKVAAATGQQPDGLVKTLVKAVKGK